MTYVWMAKVSRFEEDCGKILNLVRYVFEARNGGKYLIPVGAVFDDWESHLYSDVISLGDGKVDFEKLIVFDEVPV